MGAARFQSGLQDARQCLSINWGHSAKLEDADVRALSYDPQVAAIAAGHTVVVALAQTEAHLFECLMFFLGFDTFDQGVNPQVVDHGDQLADELLTTSGGKVDVPGKVHVKLKIVGANIAQFNQPCFSLTEVIERQLHVQLIESGVQLTNDDRVGDCGLVNL